MAIKFTDTYVNHIAATHLQPGERIVARTAGTYRPWWTFGIRWLWRTYLLIATDRRLVMVEHRRGLVYDRVEKVESLTWGDITTAKVSGLLMKKALKLSFSGGRPNLSLRLPGLFGPIPRAKQGAASVVSTWQQGRSLPPTQERPVFAAPAMSAG